MSVSQWSRRLQKGMLASVLSTMSLGLVFTGDVKAQSLSEECEVVAVTINQIPVFMATFEAEIDQFSQNAAQVETLDEVISAANQYIAAVDEVVTNLDGLSLQLRGLDLADPILGEQIDNYVVVIQGFTTALNLASDAMAIVAATESAADLPANIETSDAQTSLAVAQIQNLSTQESAILAALNDRCGVPATILPPSPVQPLPEESPVTPIPSPGNTGSNGGNGSTSTAPPRIEGYDYTEAMLMGYTAAEARDWHTALINFRRALAARPGDRYALAAIANMEAYIADERLIAARRQRALDLQSTLAEAVAIGDWACAAASVDELITLVPPNSLDRAQLVTYRGEITGFIEARDRVENWSTVCPG